MKLNTTKAAASFSFHDPNSFKGEAEESACCYCQFCPCHHNHHNQQQETNNHPPDNNDITSNQPSNRRPAPTPPVSQADNNIITAAAADYNTTTVTLQEQINCQQSLTEMLSQQQQLTKSDITTTADGQLHLPADTIISYVESGSTSGDVGLSPRNMTSPIIDL